MSKRALSLPQPGRALAAVKASTGPVAWGATGDCPGSVPASFSEAAAQYSRPNCRVKQLDETHTAQPGWPQPGAGEDRASMRWFRRHQPDAAGEW